MSRYSKAGGNMRIGLLTILTLVIIIVLAVLAVLAVSTSNAMSSLANRQATMAAEGYEAEATGQTLLSKIDDIVSGSKDQNSAIDAVSSQLTSLTGECSTDDASVSASIDGTAVTATITTKHGHTLKIKIGVNGDRSYTIEQWELSTVTESDTSDYSLWGGDASNKD